MSMVLKQCNLDLHSVIEFTGVSKLIEQQRRIVEANICLDLAVQCEIPGMGFGTFTVYLLRPGYSASATLQARMHCTILTLTGEQVVTENTDDFDDIKSSTWAHLSWGKIWLNNPTTQKDDGFRLVIDITTTDGRLEEVDDPRFLRHMASVINGYDPVDVKFLLFSRRLRDEERCGAQNPLPIYVSSVLIQNQCDFLQIGAYFPISSTGFY